jgi:hypothetical protein
MVWSARDEVAGDRQEFGRLRKDRQQTLLEEKVARRCQQYQGLNRADAAAIDAGSGARKVRRQTAQFPAQSRTQGG